MLGRVVVLGASLFVLTVGIVACDFPKAPNASVSGPEGVGGAGGLPGGRALPTGAGIGAPCASVACRTGLSCDAATKVCVAAANGVAGRPCTTTDECSPELYCSVLGACAPRSATPVGQGASCGSEGECAPGLTCALIGFSGTCVTAGQGDYGAACTGPSDCRGGLVCAAASCTPPWAVKPWPGAACTEAEEATARVLFKVPRAGEPPSEDFFALPFPNDVRRGAGGKLDLTGFPKPGLGLLSFDPVERYVTALADDVNGFAKNAVVTFRFSRKFGASSLQNHVRWIDITPASPDYGFERGLWWSASSGRTKFICPRFITVRSPSGIPLRQGTTYAVVLERGIVDEAGAPFAQDADFLALLAATPPAGDPALLAAWTAYAPLRAYIADKKVDPATMLAAAVFTTQTVEDSITKVREVVRAAMPTTFNVTGVVRCGDPGAVSPCDDGLQGEAHERGCPAAPDARFDEYQGLVSLPAFQAGKAPYENPVDGGRIEIDATTGLPKLQRTEPVCFSLTVPKGEAPAAGWPVVLYGHGTGGTFRNHVSLGLAGDYAEAAAGVKIAMLGFDGVLHGPRKAGSTKSSDDLVFNVLNPPAARDNVVQSAADLFALAAALEAKRFDAAIAGLKLDPTKLVLYGHSQGGNAGALAGGYETAFGAVVLSGAGGYLSETLLAKKKPVDIAAALPLVLGEPVGVDHPLLTLMQTYYERADPVNHVHRFAREVPMGTPGKHFLHVFGMGDNYSPVTTQRALGRAAELPVLAPLLDMNPDYMPSVLPGPVSKNGGPDAAFTVVQVQAQPGAMVDGHHVGTRVASTRQQVRDFVVGFVRDGVPVVAAPAP